MSIIPICLYNNNITDSSYIGYPAKVKTENGIALQCIEKPDTEFVTTFYAIDPDIRPVPNGMDIICATDSEGADFSTIKVFQEYDPFNVDEKCVKFLAWLEPTPNTTPLYIFEAGSGKIFISFSDKAPSPAYKQIVYSPIFILTASDKFKGTNFKFSEKDSRCVPDPNGVDLRKCIAKKQYEPSLLKKLRREKGKNEDDYQDLFMFFLFVIFLGFLLFLLKNKVKR